MEDHECPPVAILLSLRGGDPFLSDCLTKLLEQDYPNYELIVALDDENDPAVQYVDQVIDAKQPKNLTKKIIKDRQSRNGTYVNGKKIKQAQLYKGDQVLLANKYLLDWLQFL